VPRCFRHSISELGCGNTRGLRSAGTRHDLRLLLNDFEEDVRRGSEIASRESALFIFEDRLM